jgi:undecaprenyl-diphosphatase
MLIVYGVLFILVESRRRAPAVTRLEQISFKEALLIGVWQMLAIIPGTSRSGATIVGGLLLGLSRACVAEFTFFLAIPVMAGASLLKVVKFALGGVAMTGNEVAILVAGCLSAFLVSLASIRFLMNYVKRHDFKFFGVYRIVLGLVVLAVACVSAFL